MENIQKLADDLLEFTQAKSVFLYGSRVREDFYEESDYEIGVLMEKDKYTNRSDIRKQFELKGVHIFPFKYEDFIVGNLDTPFVKSIYLREIIEAGKTLAGEDVIERLKPPEIKLLAVIQSIRFNLGYALAATHSYRNKDNETASLHFVKSCLFGTRDYIIFRKKRFCIDYDEIVKNAKELDLEDFYELPICAYKLRRREVDINEQNLFKNISYRNQFIENKLIAVFKEKGDIVLIK